MTANLPQTSSKLDGPLVKQFSVFLPNKVGAMLEIVKLLSAHHTHVVALSVSESTDSAIARIIASDRRVWKIIQGKQCWFRRQPGGGG
jgi:ACT domain-containing protein